MGDITSPQPVLSLVAAFSMDRPALDWAKDRCVAAFGPVALESPLFEFVETDYYTPTMGAGLKKVFWAFETLIDPGRLAEIKRLTNDWEAEYAAARSADCGVPRPLNLDPGYIGLGKLVLASTKDHAHRIYLGQGIYAEVTLFYKDHRWQPRDWTFADYRRADYHAYFEDCRQYLKGRLDEGRKA